MNTERNQRLEQQVDIVLKALPDLQAPPTLVPRVLAILEHRSSIPWYRQAWQSWSAAARTGALAGMLALFSALCFGAWKATQLDGVVAATDRVRGWTALLNTACNTIHVVWTALGHAVQQYGTSWIVAFLVAAGLGYALCIGLGTLCVRLALARPQDLKTYLN
jgi:hypothetical protein